MNFKLTSLVAVITLGTAISAQANEVDAYCKLAQVQAEVKSELIGSAEVFGNIGDPVTAGRTMTVGVRKSLSRSRQADTATQLGAAECSAYRATKKLEEQIAGVEARGELQALIQLRPLLVKALEAAKANVAQEQALLASQHGRIADLKTAVEQADHIRAELASADLRRSRVQHQLPEEDAPIKELLDNSIAAQADVADLTSKLQVQSAWDVTVAAGSRTDLRNHQHEGFVAVTASMSLGRNNAAQQAGRIADLTANLLREQRDGGVQSFIRAKDSLQGVLAAEMLSIDTLTGRKALLAETLARLDGVDTTEGLRTQRALKVEILLVDALLTSANSRADYLRSWLARNA